jgi:potassium efflux system protein
MGLGLKGFVPLPPLPFFMRFLCLILAWLGSQAAAYPYERLNLESLEQEQKALEAANLPEEQRKKALDPLNQASQWLRQAQTANSLRQDLEKTAREAPKRLVEIRQLLEHPEKLARDLPALDLSRPLEWLEIYLAQEESALAQDQSVLEKKERELSEVLGAATSSQQIATLEQELQEVESELLKASPESPQAPLERARRLSLEARRIWLQAELNRLRLRQANLAILTELSRAERDAAALLVAIRRSRLERLRQAIQSARERQVLSAAEEAKLALETSEPEIRKELETNLSLWAELEDLIGEGKKLKHAASELKQQLETLQNDFEKIQQAVSLAGTDEAIAKLLRKRLKHLSAMSSSWREAKALQSELKLAITRRFEIEEALKSLSDLDALIDAKIKTLPPETSETRRAVLRLKWQEAFNNRRKALEALQQEYTRHLSALSELNANAEQLQELTQSYRAYLEKKLLWIRYSSAPSKSQGLFTRLNLKAITEMGSNLSDLAQANPTPLGFLALLVSSLFFLRRRIEQDLQLLAQLTRNIRTDRFLNTLRALGDTLLLATPVPLLLLGLGLWLEQTLNRVGTVFEPVPLFLLAQGLIEAGKLLAAISFLRQVCRTDGLAHRHLRWPAVIREQLFHKLRWFGPWAAVCAFSIAASGDPINPSLSAGRWMFVLLLLSVSFLNYRLWREPSELSKSKPSWLITYHPLWFPLVILGPVFLAFGAAVGFYYAALYLGERLFHTLWYSLALLLSKDFLLRWLYVTERRLRYQEILRRREELKAAKPAAESGELPPVEEPQVDFGRLSEQTRRLFRIGFFSATLIGLWWIWKDAVPAISFLEQVTLPMTATKTVGGVSKEVPLTLADVVTGLLLGLLTVLAAKNLPGLLEFAVLQRLPLEKGARYAWTALSQYLIAALGVYVIFSSLGVRWADIQWLVAALSVGVGFGLQEVVANFISGLILLFERPIRVGDLVTVGNVTGTVSKIRIRATTILNWDRQELIIPNKNFITGEFINWTLTDTVNRIRIEVGIAYGSDVAKALGLMLEAALEHPEVLAEPKPQVTFEGFGDNALLLVLRAYLGALDNRLATITELHQAIYTKFHAAGIAIAFPQRDVHLDTSRPLEVKICREEV